MHLNLDALIYTYFYSGLVSLTFPLSNRTTDIITYIYAFILFLLGGAIASFMCVVAERGMEGEKWWGKERSRCNECGRILHWYELLPVFSYLMQKGKCRVCGTVIPLRYFVAELTSGLFLALAYLSYGCAPETLVAIALLPFFIFHYITDIETEFLYDGITAGIGIVAIIYRLYLAMSLSQYVYILSSFIALLIVIVLTLPLAYSGKFGTGDVLLYGALAILVGKTLVFPLLFLSSVLAVAYIIVISIYRYFQTNLKGNIIPYKIPFGPFLCAAAGILFLCSPIIS